jgi:hypothetical protein
MEIVERLRDVEPSGIVDYQWALCQEAADLLEAQAAQLQEARELMRDVIEGWDWWNKDQYDRCQSVPGDAIAALRAFLAKS